MPSSRGSGGVQRVSPRGPPPLKTSRSDSDPIHNRPITDRSSPKVGDRRSPRGAVQSEPLSQKKLGTRIAGLETQLDQAQEELKILKNQLALAEAAKKEAQKQLEKKKITKPNGTPPKEENASDDQKETDVFEVPVEKATVELPEQDDLKTKLPEVPDKTLCEELSEKNDELNLLKIKVEEMEKQLEVFGQENESLKCQLSEATSLNASAKAMEEDTSSKLSKLEEELEKSKNDTVQLNDKLKDVEAAKETLEDEMKKLRVQTEQWRKAADAAAAVLSGGVEMNERRVAERCGSMEKHYGGNVYELGYGDSPGFGDVDDGFGNGKKKGSGMKMFGDLWKKKGQK